MSDQSWLQRFWHGGGRTGRAAESSAAVQGSPCRSGASAVATSFVNHDPSDSEEDCEGEVDTRSLSSQSNHRRHEYLSDNGDNSTVVLGFQSVADRHDNGSSGRRLPDEARGDDERSTPLAAARRVPCAQPADQADTSCRALTDFNSVDNSGSSWSSLHGQGSGSRINNESPEEERQHKDVPKRPVRPPRHGALPTRVIENPAYDLSSDDDQPRLALHAVPPGRVEEDDDDDSDGAPPRGDYKRLRRIDAASTAREVNPFSANDDHGITVAEWRHVGSYHVCVGENVSRDSRPLADEVALSSRTDPLETRVDRDGTRCLLITETADVEERRLRRGIRDPKASHEERVWSRPRRDIGRDNEERDFVVADLEESEFHSDEGSDSEQVDIITRRADRQERELQFRRNDERDIVVCDVEIEDDGSDTDQRDIVVEFESSGFCRDDRRNPEHRDSNSIGIGLEEGEFQHYCDAEEQAVDVDVVVLVEDGECRPADCRAEAAYPGRPRGGRDEDLPRNELIEEDEVVVNREIAEEVVVVSVGPAVITPTGRGELRNSGRPAQTMEGGEGSASQAVETSVTDAATQQAEARTLKDENNFIQNVSQFFNQEDISDVVLKVGHQKFYGHKFVLAKSSEVFRTMLYDKRWQQSHLPEIDLAESEECQRHFEPFLRFLYTAEIQICTESAVGILCLADKYSVMSLKALCTRYMVENTLSPKVRNALNWYSWAKALHMAELIDSCTKTISWNMEQLFALPEWLQMDIDFVADIVSNPQLVVSNEFLLYEAVERWLLNEQHFAELSENSKKLLPLVRFPQMMVQQLYKVETGELASKEGSKELIEKLLNKAYRFRSLCPFQADLDITFSDEFYRPRNYKDLTVDTVRMQNTLRFGIQVDVRTYVGPVPSSVREGEWKITYRKTNDTWTLQVYCHDSAMVNGEARIQAVLVISDDDDRVLQVEASDETVCSRGSHLTMVITLPSTNDAKLMTVLIKPLPN